MAKKRSIQERAPAADDLIAYAKGHKGELNLKVFRRDMANPEKRVRISLAAAGRVAEKLDELKKEGRGHWKLTKEN